MRLFSVKGFAAMFAAGVMIIVSGCGGSDKGTGSDSSLTAEEQYALLNEFLVGPDGAFEGDISTLLLGQVNRSYWDGIDQTDFSPPAFLAGNPKIAAVEADSFSFTYNSTSGWWHVYSDLSFDFGAQFHLTSRDSVRFENASGQPMEDPDETTIRVRHGSAFIASILLDEPENFLDLDLSTGSNLQVAGLNTDFLTLNGNSVGNLDMHVEDADTTVVFAIDIASTVGNVLLPNEKDSCPVDGDLSATLGMVFDIEAGDESAHAEGDWTLDVNINNDGSADAEFHSGSTSISADVSVCGGTDDSR